MRDETEAELLEIAHWLGANIGRTQHAKDRVVMDRKLTANDKARRLAELEARARARHEELLQRRADVLENWKRTPEAR